MPKLRCPHCQQKLKVPDDWGGKRIRCPGCKQAIRVPSVGAAAGSSPAPSAQTPRKPAPSKPAPREPAEADVFSEALAMERQGPPAETRGHTPGRTPAPEPPTDSTIPLADDSSGEVALRSAPERSDSPTMQRMMARAAENADHVQQQATGQEEQVRRRNITVLGMVMILGFLLPIVVVVPSGPGLPGSGGMHVVHLNFAVFQMPEPPPEAVLTSLLPLLLGGAAIGVGLLVKSPFRGVILVVLGLLPFLIVLSSEDARMLLSLMGGEMIGELTLAVLVPLVGLGATWVGARSRTFRPGSLTAYVIGAAGAALVLLSLLRDIMAPFELFRLSILLGLSSLAMMICLAGAAGICIGNIPGRPMKPATELSKLACALLIVGLFVGLAVPVLQGVGQSGRASFGMFLTVISLLVKMAMVAVGVLFLTPMGVTDLIIGPADAAPDKA